MAIYVKVLLYGLSDNYSLWDLKNIGNYYNFMCNSSSKISQSSQRQNRRKKTGRNGWIFKRFFPAIGGLSAVLNILDRLGVLNKIENFMKWLHLL
jgi:hypothetical protein